MGSFSAAFAKCLWPLVFGLRSGLVSTSLHLAVAVNSSPGQLMRVNVRLWVRVTIRFSVKARVTLVLVTSWCGMS